MQTKYPIILVHGIAKKDWRFFRAFGRIDKMLSKEGFHVYVSKHDGFGAIETNAEQIRMQIMDILEKEGADKINIIAHSKGGMDSKYMIKSLGMENHVASLTTLCTPHRGTPIASFILKWPNWMVSVVGFFVNLWYRIFGDKHPNAIKVCKELQRTKVDENELMNFSDKVYCQSFSCKMKKVKDDFTLGIPLMFSHYYEKGIESDGLVPQDSTIFGEYKGEAINGEGISHNEIVDFMATSKTREKVYKFYVSLAEDLAKRGY